MLEQKGICALCGILPEWNGMPLVFQYDHINEDHHDEQRENVRMICPTSSSSQSASKATSC
jgi:hypothetical protein